MPTSEEACFPHIIAYGLTRIFRVQAVSASAYHIDQQQPAGNWKTIAISNDSKPQEAIEVMEDAQLYYMQELQRRRQMSQNLQGGLNVSP